MVGMGGKEGQGSGVSKLWSARDGRNRGIRGLQDGRLAARRRVAIREVRILTATATKRVRVSVHGMFDTVPGQN